MLYVFNPSACCCYCLFVNLVDQYMSMNFNTFTSVISVQWPLDSTQLKEYNLCHSSARTLRVLVPGMSHLLFDVKILSIKIRVFGHVDKEFGYLV